ncbi:MAG: veratrol--corrinoid protein metyltransferase [Clostridiales bacterium]|nr:veratrol--corrinoid protein metyltransferase [Clostridiales bacterium]
MTPKQNYLTMLRGEIPEYIPSMYEERIGRFTEDLLTPTYAPNGPIVTSLGVTYVGSPDLNNGAMPKPGVVILDDITKWRDVIKAPDLSDFAWGSYYREKIKDIDRENKYISVGGGDYFLTLVSFMGFENALIALYEEPEEVKALLDYVSEFYLLVLKQQLRYVKPDVMSLMDDDAALRAPFFSVAMYREFFKPYHKLHCDLALENNMPIERHDCGRCESFIPDWVEIGIRGWNPAQPTNDLVGIKKKYTGKLAICGGWDNMKYSKCFDEDVLRAALTEYVDTFAPGGGFSFAPMMGGKPDDPLVQKRSKLIKDFYFEYAHDWYKTH